MKNPLEKFLMKKTWGIETYSEKNTALIRIAYKVLKIWHGSSSVSILNWTGLELDYFLIDEAWIIQLFFGFFDHAPTVDIFTK